MLLCSVHPEHYCVCCAHARCLVELCRLQFDSTKLFFENLLGSKEKFSKSAVQQMKETLKELGHSQKSQMSKASVAELKSFDDSAEKMEFQHLPSGRKTLEFQLDKDLEFEDILDFVLLHGDSPEDLTVQSFFNFDVQKFTKLRLITTMCDTLACFLGLNNENPLSQHPLVVGNNSLHGTKELHFQQLSN